MKAHAFRDFWTLYFFQQFSKLRVVVDDVPGVGLFPYMDGCVDVFKIFLDELILGMRFLVCIGPVVYKIFGVYCQSP